MEQEILQNPYMTPAGERMLWLVLFVLTVAGVFTLWRKYRAWKNSPLRIRKRVWYSGGLMMSVNIRNIRSTIVEMNAPVIEFREPRMKKRKFRIIAPGDEDIFPLGLSPQTGYDFIVEFTRLYEREPVLRRYHRVIIHAVDVRGRTIIRRKVKISLPK